ncbi:uncharacterized protein LOC113509021 [Trichoplusia ni]|uniref:Uncharacterized protein LOC113509021 n=1 Tax=Trichoplusia ni TaxID=7111 RepID=A0A7E5X4B7_TRINI|nr:uncharacterized protein LOC113509021 [Trichoplusia ni]XP_026748059.1 uncharacterized protein LOC113509021 [Trichoplusia ni]XP_026748060.1 uncharacterized protein LOC113509021 [Trichoplusia ni]XP_026748061.1 uncharacterized protein LOC113509021 [Trichoplusia ni]XP_026748063.1 uncharacterized protein LOC113509021 [Trichoplusia ni]
MPEIGFLELVRLNKLGYRFYTIKNFSKASECFIMVYKISLRGDYNKPKTEDFEKKWKEFIISNLYMAAKCYTRMGKLLEMVNVCRKINEMRPIHIFDYACQFYKIGQEEELKDIKGETPDEYPFSKCSNPLNVDFFAGLETPNGEFQCF